ncbi:glycosyltransferase [Tepidimonas alkaliphilus]|uniref:glycosyltransferase n=1 Tax=Tepidimonas alkaliphilus TaxID=2588942 RepID=UPI00163DDE2E|nr:glycosyltransferase [Tepidimonas alkaliphilus]
MIAYNQEKFIGPALESVLNQTYDNIEVVVGDDCSSDGTWDVICEYKARFPGKIVAFRNERNLGITANSNEVLRRCRGKYVAHMGGDDLFLPEKIAKQVAAMEADERIVLCYHDIEVFQSETNETICFKSSGSKSYPPKSGFAHAVVKHVVESGNMLMAAMSVMVRRDAIPEHGYDYRVPYASDWLMWIEVLAGSDANARVVFLPEVLARYRRHENNITNRSNVYRADPYVTLAITEAKYPWLVPAVRKAIVRMRYSRGINYILAGDASIGRLLLLESLRCGWVSPKIFYWLLVSYFPWVRRRNKLMEGK